MLYVVGFGTMALIALAGKGLVFLATRYTPELNRFGDWLAGKMVYPYIFLCIFLFFAWLLLKLLFYLLATVSIFYFIWRIFHFFAVGASHHFFK